MISNITKAMRICQHDPCWCGFKAQLDNLIERENIAMGFRSWTQEAHDRFMKNEDKHR